MTVPEQNASLPSPPSALSRGRARQDAETGFRTLRDVVDDHTRVLAAGGVPSPRADARALARHALGLSSAGLTTATVDDVDPTRLAHLAGLVARRADRVPLQHLTGETGFRRLTIACQPGVFVPRPETEILAGEVIRRLDEVADPTVVEPCTGTGAVALAIVDEVADVRVVGTDVSPEAIRLANENRDRLAREGTITGAERCEFHSGDLFAPLGDSLRHRVDVVVCNPPYLTAEEVDGAEPEVRDHDPRRALVADLGGLAVIDRLLDEAADWLRPDGVLLLEVAEERARDAARRAEQAGYRDVSLAADLAERTRVLAARWPARQGAAR